MLWGLSILQPGDRIGDALQALFNDIHTRRIRHPRIFIRAECNARHHRDFSFLEQVIREIERALDRSLTP